MATEYPKYSTTVLAFGCGNGGYTLCHKTSPNDACSNAVKIPNKKSSNTKSILEAALKIDEKKECMGVSELAKGKQLVNRHYTKDAYRFTV